MDSMQMAIVLDLDQDILVSIYMNGSHRTNFIPLFLYYLKYIYIYMRTQIFSPHENMRKFEKSPWVDGALYLYLYSWYDRADINLSLLIISFRVLSFSIQLFFRVFLFQSILTPSFFHPKPRARSGRLSDRVELTSHVSVRPRELLRRGGRPRPIRISNGCKHRGSRLQRNPLRPRTWPHPRRRCGWRELLRRRQWRSYSASQPGRWHHWEWRCCLSTIIRPLYVHVPPTVQLLQCVWYAVLPAPEILGMWSKVLTCNLVPRCYYVPRERKSIFLFWVKRIAP